MDAFDIGMNSSKEPWDITDCYQVQSHIVDNGRSGEETDPQGDLERNLMFQLTAHSILLYYVNYIHKVPCRTSVRTGDMLIEEILNGNETRCYANFRMTKTIFMDLCYELKHKYGLQPTRGMSIHEEVGIFFMICGHGTDNRLMQEIFNHSGETISRHFHRVLEVVSKLASDNIRPHPNYNDGEGYHRPQHERYKPYFDNCIGAIDGTHVKARLPEGEAIPYMGRKGYATLNILAVVDFNMCFTFAWAGWEGAAHDSRILAEAIRSLDLNFPHPNGQKYYMVDAGYSHGRGYMGPYKGGNVRYHLEDFRRARTSQLRKPKNYKEKFNYLHSSCRNIVERTFGVWKARWKILSDMPYYHIDTQREIVLATMAIHNYIRKKKFVDRAFRIAEDENYDPQLHDATETSARATQIENENDQDNIYWNEVRDSIAKEIADRG